MPARIWPLSFFFIASVEVHKYALLKIVYTHTNTALCTYAQSFYLCRVPKKPGYNISNIYSSFFGGFGVDGYFQFACDLTKRSIFLPNKINKCIQMFGVSSRIYLHICRYARIHIFGCKNKGGRTIFSIHTICERQIVGNIF